MVGFYGLNHNEDSLIIQVRHLDDFMSKEFKSGRYMLTSEIKSSEHCLIGIERPMSISNNRPLMAMLTIEIKEMKSCSRRTSLTAGSDQLTVRPTPKSLQVCYMGRDWMSTPYVMIKPYIYNLWDTTATTTSTISLTTLVKHFDH